MIVLKASKISHLTDARYFSARGASVMGFDLDPGSPDFVKPEQVHAISDWVDGVQLAGEFGQNSIEEILHLSDSLKLDYIQLPHNYDRENLMELSGKKIIQQVLVEKSTTAEELTHQITDLAPLTRAVELDFVTQNINPLAGEGFGIEGLNRIIDLHHCFIKAPLTPDSMANLSKLTSFPGLTFTGSHEEKVGFKSFEDIDTIIDYLEEQQWFDPYA